MFWGAEEDVEQRTQNLGSNVAIGGNRPIGQDTFVNAVGGFVGGAGFGGAAGVMAPTQKVLPAAPTIPFPASATSVVPDLNAHTDTALLDQINTAHAATETTTLQAIESAQTVDEAIAATQAYVNLPAVPATITVPGQNKAEVAPAFPAQAAPEVIGAIPPEPTALPAQNEIVQPAQAQAGNQPINALQQAIIDSGLSKTSPSGAVQATTHSMAMGEPKGTGTDVSRTLTDEATPVPDITRLNGQTFSTEKAATFFARAKKLEGVAPVEVSPGQFVLRPLEPAIGQLNAVQPTITPPVVPITPQIQQNQAQQSLVQPVLPVPTAIPQVQPIKTRTIPMKSGGVGKSPSDVISEALDKHQTRDKFMSYLRGRLGRKVFSEQQKEIERRWGDRTQPVINQSKAALNKEPWQMTAREWDQAREATRPNIVQSDFTKHSASQASSKINGLEKLLYGVSDEASQKLAAAAKGDVTLTPGEVDKLLARVDTPVRHRDVVEKALREGKPVPKEALTNYPDLKLSQETKAEQPVLPKEGENIPVSGIPEASKVAQKENSGARNVATKATAEAMQAAPDASKEVTAISVAVEKMANAVGKLADKVDAIGQPAKVDNNQANVDKATESTRAAHTRKLAERVGAPQAFADDLALATNSRRVEKALETPGSKLQDIRTGKTVEVLEPAEPFGEGLDRSWSVLVRNADGNKEYIPTNRLWIPSETKETGQGTAMFSRQSPETVYDPEWQQQLNAALDLYERGEMTRRDMIPLGITPPVLRMLGLERLPLRMAQDIVPKATEDKHAISMEHLRMMVEAIADPIAVFDSDSPTAPKGSLVVLTNMKDVEGSPIIVAVHRNQKDGTLDINKVGSVYGKSRQHVVGRWFRTALRYEDTQRSPEWRTWAGVQSPGHSNQLRGLRTRVRARHDLVNFIGKVGFSRATEDRPSAGLSISDATARQAVISAFGEKATAVLEREGLLNFVNSPQDFPSEIHPFMRGNEEAVYWEGRSWIVKSASPPDIVTRVLHEIGEHHGLKGMLGEVSYTQLQRRITFMNKAGNATVRDAWNKVIKAEPDMKEGSEWFIAEVIARVGQDQRVQTQTWWRQLMDAIKTFIIKHYTLPAGKITEDHIQTLLRASVMAAARKQGKPSFMSGEEVAASRTTNSMFSRTPDEVQAAGSPPEETKAQAAQRRIQDNFNRFKVLQNWLKGNGIALSEGADVYLAETSSRSKIAVRLQDFREQQMQPLIKKTQKASLSMGQIGDYLLAQHALEANRQIRKIHQDEDATAFGMTDEEASNKMSELEKLPNFDQLKSIANEWRSVTEQTKKIKLDGGFISQEMVDAWDATYENYIPVKGTEEQKGSGAGKGLSVYAREKRRMGHSARDEAIIENIWRDHERAISMDERNRVGKSLIMFLLEANNPEIGTVGKPVKRQVLKPGQSSYMVTYHGSDVATFDNLSDARRHIAEEALRYGRNKADFDVVKTTDPVRVMLQASGMAADNEVNVYVGGQAVKVQINDEIAAREYKAMGVEHLGAILSAGREINTWLSKVYTGYSPDFIFTNPIRDAIQGAITLTGAHGAKMAAKIFSVYPRAVKELAQHIRKHGSSELVSDFRAHGGFIGAAYLPDLERIGKNIESSYNEYAGAVDTFNRAYEKAIKDGRSKATAISLASLKSGIAGFRKIPVIGHILKFIERINSITENALRVATYTALVVSIRARSIERAIPRGSRYRRARVQVSIRARSIERAIPYQDPTKPLSNSGFNPRPLN